MNVQEKAQQYLDCFECKEVEKEKRWFVKDDGDPKVTEMVFESHDGMMPDNYKYSFAVDSLQALIDYEDSDDALEGIEQDVYTHELLLWISSNNTRVEYLTQALEEFDMKDGLSAIGMAQWLEKQEVFFSVKNYIENILEEENGE